MGSIGANKNNSNSILNSAGELRNGQTTIIKSKRGISYYVKNVNGEYEVWTRKSVSAPGGYKLVDEFHKPTKEIKDRVKLERS